MKIQEFRKLIREEVYNVLNEAKSWNKKSINDFFKYLQDMHGMKSKPIIFKTDTSGTVEIFMGGPSFYADFAVKGSDLVFKTKSDSDVDAKDLLDDVMYDMDGEDFEKFKIQAKGKLLIVNII